MNNNFITKNSPNENTSSKELLESIKQDIIIDSQKLENNSFFQKNFGNRETLFYIVLPSFKKILKDEIDKKLISLYLTHMKKFVDLLKKVYASNSNSTSNNTNTTDKNVNDDEFYELLNNVSAYMLYHYFPANRVLMRFGDEGEKFYILLNGTVNIIVTRKKTVNISLNEYFRYIALLIIYKEQQILKQVVKENKNSNFIDIPGIDFFFIVLNEPNPLILMRDIYLGIYNKNNKNFNSSKISTKSNYSQQSKKNKKRRKSSYNDPKKINIKELENEFLKVEEFLNMYLTNEELTFYYNSLNDEKYDIFEYDDNVNVSPQNYVKRLLNYSYDISMLKEKNIKNLKEKIGQIKTNDKKINKLNIYEYNILVELNSGDMFGEAALSAPSLKRNATIMTVTDCHFGCLNRKIYQKHIQKATETNKKNTINYICSTGIFNGYPKDILNKKFFSVFVFKKNKKNDFIIKQKEVNNNIILIKEGVFEIIFNGNMIDIYNLINIYYRKLLSLENNEQDEELHMRITKIKGQKQKIEKMLGAEMYKNEEYKILLIDSPSTFGLREVEEKLTQKDKVGNITYHYMSYYDVKCNSVKGEYILIDKNTFYRQIYSTEYSVQESTKIIARQFISKIINRLLYIRLSKIYNLFLSKETVKDIYFLPENKNIFEGFHYNINSNYNNDFYKRINTLIDKCDEGKFSSNNFAEYVHNYFEIEKEKNLKEKREFKNRKERIKQNKIRKNLFKEHCNSFANTNTNTNQKNFSMTRVSSAINSKSKISFIVNKDRDRDKEKLHLTKNEKIVIISAVKNNRNIKKYIDLKYYKSKSKLNFSPKDIKKKFNIQTKLKKNKEEFNFDRIFTHKFKNKKNNYIFQDSILSLDKKDFFKDKVKRCENEDYKNNSNICNINPKFNIIGGKNYISIPKLFLNKSKSVYDLKAENQQNFIKNRSNYIINITRSFFTKKKDFNRKIRLKSS